jgi:hypothetical protein
MYTLYPDFVLRADGLRIPMSEENTDFSAYLKWVAEGNTPALPPVPTIAELVWKAKAETRIQRQPIITILDGLQSSALTAGDLPMAQVIETAKQALRDITDLNLFDCTTYEQMKAKTLQRYMQIASASPALKSAFKDALQ